mgnify:CR=1 FL=1
MIKLKKVLFALLLYLGIQMTGMLLYDSFLKDNKFIYIGAIGNFILLTSLLIIKVLEVEE